MNIDEAIQEFLASGRQVGWSPQTVRNYNWYLQRMRIWLELRRVRDVTELNRDVLRQWGAGLHDAWRPATVKASVAAARSFLRWLNEEEILTVDLRSALRMPKVPVKIQRTLSVDEVARLIRACETPVRRGVRNDLAFATAVRNAAIVTLMFDSLLRASEMVGLQVDDIDLEGLTVTVRAAKNGRARVAPFGPDTAVALRAWLEVRRPATQLPWLIVSLGGRRPGRQLTTRGLRIIVKNVGQRAGVKNVSPHTFRRGGAVAATMAGAPSRLVQVWGGWDNIRMVELYTRALTAGSLTARVFPKYSPVSAAKRRRALQSGPQRPG